MHYVYVLQSRQNGELYVRCTRDLKARYTLHNAGKVPSTAGKLPVKLIYYEALMDKQDAFTREQWLKTGWGRNQLKTILRNYLKV